MSFAILAYAVGVVIGIPAHRDKLYCFCAWHISYVGIWDITPIIKPTYSRYKDIELLLQIKGILTHTSFKTFGCSICCQKPHKRRLKAHKSIFCSYITILFLSIYSATVNFTGTPSSLLPAIHKSNSPGSTIFSFAEIQKARSEAFNVNFTSRLSPGCKYIFSKPFNSFTDGQANRRGRAHKAGPSQNQPHCPYSSPYMSPQSSRLFPSKLTKALHCHIQTWYTTVHSRKGNAGPSPASR